MIEFNVNDYMQVKLTSHGRKIYRDHWRELGIQPPPINENEVGWSRWQLWDLMFIFGSQMFNGHAVPFETTIRIETDAK